MGNFGKRLLIVLLSAVAFVTLALVGNAYQQAERVHKVSKQSQVIYSGTYENKSYTLTKKNVWDAIITSDATDNIVEMLNMYLLQSVIDGISDTDERIAAKKNYLIYGTTDEDTIAEYQLEKNSESNEKLVKAFNDKMVVLGYSEKGEKGHTIADYCKYLIACDEYARYRLENNLEISGTTYDLSDDTLKETYSAGYEDTFAISIKFYSEDEALDYIKRENSNLAIVSSVIRYYVGDSKYKVESVESINNINKASENELNYKTTEIVVTEDDPDTTDVNEEKKITVKIPNASIDTETVDDETVYQTLSITTYDKVTVYDSQKDLSNSEDDTVYNIIWKSSDSTDTTTYGLFFDSENNKWRSIKVSSVTTQNKKDENDEDVLDESGNVVTEEVTTYEEITSDNLSTKSTYSSTTLTSYEDQTSFTSSNTVELTETQFLELYIALYNEYYATQLKKAPALVDYSAFDLTSTDLQAKLKDLGYAVVGTEIRKYVGNEEYVVDLEESKDGYPVYKTYTASSTEYDLPNYKIVYDGDDPKLDKDNNLIYELDENGDRIANDDKKDIKDVTEFTTSNTIAINDAQLYALYIQLVANQEDIENLIYNYEEINAARSTFATELFETLTIDEEDGAYLKTASSVESSSSDTDPYYLIFKLSDSALKDEATEEELKAIKEDKINEYLTATGFVDACMAELRGEAGLVFYDKFFALDYEGDIAYDSSSNTYGVSDEDEYDNYFKAKGYKANKVAALTKKVDVMGTEVDKCTLTADDLYDYSMEYSGASYLANAASEKIVLECMDEFTQIHGTDTNYLTSKNWLMELYASTVESYNQMYEYYKQLYASYGYDYYDSVDEFLYSYGTRSYDNMVKQLEKSTMKNILIYKELVGALTDTTLTEYGKTMLTNNDNFKAISEDYMSLDVNHLLFGIDLDEDGSPDDYDDFLADLEEGKINLQSTGTDKTKKITTDEYNVLINELYLLLLEYVDDNASSLSTLTTALSDFVTEYNEESRFGDDDEDAKYAKFKAYGIILTNESFEITRSTLGNYDKKFQEAVEKLQEKLERIDNELLGYSVYDGLCRSSFGDHYIVASPCESLNAPSFKYTESSKLYAEGIGNESDTVSEKQIVLYIQQQIYTTIFGDTDNPEANAAESGYADFEYPNLPTTITENIESLYADYLDLILDTSYSYHTTYIVLGKLVKDGSSYTESFKKLQDVYLDAILDN